MSLHDQDRPATHGGEGGSVPVGKQVCVWNADSAAYRVESSTKHTHQYDDGTEGLDQAMIDAADIDRYAEIFYERRKHRGVTMEDARREARDPLMFAALMVNAGDADGFVGGCVRTTAATVRAAILGIGPAKGIKTISSFFLMIMPDGDGLDLVRWIQRNAAGVPVAVITAHGNVEAAVRALKLGAYDFVSKPLKVKDLRKLVATALRLRG